MSIQRDLSKNERGIATGERRASIPASIVLLDLSDICAAFNVHPDTVRGWVRQKLFPSPTYPPPSSNVGKWTLAQVEAHLAKRRRGRRVRKPRGFQLKQAPHSGGGDA